jgi:hypothetical protein
MLPTLFPYEWYECVIKRTVNCEWLAVLFGREGEGGGGDSVVNEMYRIFINFEF